MTAPGPQVLRPGGGARLRRRLGLVGVASAMLTALFVAATVAGVAILRAGVAIGALMAVAYLIATLLSLRVVWVARRARTVVVGDAIDAAVLAWARRSSRANSRRANLLTLFIVLAGGVFSLVSGDIGQTLLAILCAIPALSWARAARSLGRLLPS
jgi:hypothetical protein